MPKLSTSERSRSRSAMVVGIPARNEVKRLRSSLDSIRWAADLVPPGIDVLIVVGCDSCNDGTSEVAAELARTDTRLHVLVGDWQSAGATRRCAIDHGLAILRERGIDVADIWIATTDADTVVPSDWLINHLAYSRHGYDAIAGVVDLRPDSDRTLLVHSTFDAAYDVGPTDHPHVHGANMGVCAGAYSTVGGFPHIPLAEDHALWDALRAAGFRCGSPPSLVVATSARLRGRAAGGFADTLHAQVHGVEFADLAEAKP